jgi:hypothetical protein
MELDLIHSNKIKKKKIKVFNTFDIGYCKFYSKSVFHRGITNQVDNQSNTKLQFNLDTCCTQGHKAKYSMNMQYPILCTPKIVWAPYHIFRLFEGYCIALSKLRKNTIPSLGHTTISLSKYFRNTLGNA